MISSTKFSGFATQHLGQRGILFSISNNVLSLQGAWYKGIQKCIFMKSKNTVTAILIKDTYITMVMKLDPTSISISLETKDRN